MKKRKLNSTNPKYYPVIDRIEYDLKDELIRQTIMDTQEDVEEIKETIDKIDQRLYEISAELRQIGRAHV